MDPRGKCNAVYSECSKAYKKPVNKAEWIFPFDLPPIEFPKPSENEYNQMRQLLWINPNVSEIHPSHYASEEVVYFVFFNLHV